MKIVIATDKFKGSLTASGAAKAMADGVRDTNPDAHVLICPMADGGEGTVDAIAASLDAVIEVEEVTGPLPDESVDARWAHVPTVPASEVAGDDEADRLVRPEAKTAIIEMAQASGFSLVPEQRRDPMKTTTFGTGQLITAALDNGCRQLIVGIGGSATVDGGTGMARALGYRFLQDDGREIPLGGGALERISSIDASRRDPRIGECRFLVASDVDNPLVGPRGAARIYGPQKGASPEQVEILEKGLRRLGALMEEELGAGVLDLPGAGAAGGLGAGLFAFCDALILRGVELVADLVRLREKIAGADLILTGEGSFDAQSAYGKTPVGVVEVARKAGVPVVVVAGRIASEAGDLLDGDVAVFSVSPGPMDEAEAMKRARPLVRSGTARLMRLLLLMSDRDV